MAHLQESGRLSPSRCKLWIMPLVAFSYARNQKIGRCDLPTWGQISMAHRQKQFQVKSLAKALKQHRQLAVLVFPKETKYRVSILIKAKIPMAHLQESGDIHEVVANFGSLHLAILGIRKRPVNLESNLNGTPPKAIPGQKPSQSIETASPACGSGISKRNKIQGVHSHKS